VTDEKQMPDVACVDFDGTLCRALWPGIGAPRTFIIEGVKYLRKMGYQLVLHTCRTGQQLQEAVTWCANQGIVFDAVNENTKEMLEYWGDQGVPPSPKPSAKIYIDDLAMNADDFELWYKNRSNLFAEVVNGKAS